MKLTYIQTLEETRQTRESNRNGEYISKTNNAGSEVLGSVTPSTTQS